ncbi:hypothetical protein AA11826_0842 [Komagataeibacter oboediens DSM 11826]|uniref:Uncharacterized protein n=1 Tax=Komagataeibacter oboediens TaxID=65958 RepID=A0A318QNQ2_9PROT|nr:hypothetical protein [Komagataeibacter oboediens]PYD80050.1 hypothetical protein CFR80_14300 [Komagataeibacter oboediens]GBR31789.1 hypothetical protein AA11826_0842 [Komagataeibacter oboediens DSM 11826]
MSETFAVSGEYNLKSDAPEVLERITRGFREAIDTGERLLGVLDRLEGGVNLSRLIRQLKEVGGINLSGLTSTVREAGLSFDTITTSAREASEAIRQVKEASNGMRGFSIPTPVPSGTPIPGGSPVPPSPNGPPVPPAPGGQQVPGRPPLTMGHVAHNAMTIGFDIDMYGEAAKSALRPSLDLAQTRQRLIASSAGNVADADAAIRQAQDLQRTIPGTNVMDNIDVYSILLRQTQNAEQARALVPTFLPTGVAAEAFHPESGNYAHQLESLVQLAEFRGALLKTDPKTGEEHVDLAGAQNLGRILLASEASSLGDIDFRKVLQFTRSAGVAGANISAEDYPYVSPIIQGMGAARAGTGLQGMEQQFSAGRMSQAGANMLIEMGLIKGGGDAKHNPNLMDRGMGVYQMKPSALEEGQFEQIAFHPREFVSRTLLPMVDRQLAKDYGTKFTNANSEERRVYETNEMAVLASRIPGGTFMAEVVRTLLLSARDAQATNRLANTDLTGIMKEAPSVQINSFTGSLKNLTATLGSAPFKDGLAALGLLTSTLNFASKEAQRHPNVAQPLSTAATDLTFAAAASALLKWTGRTLLKYAPEGAGAVAGRAAQGVGSRFMPVALGIGAWDLLSPMVDKMQAHLEQNNETLRRLDAWLGAHSGGMFGTNTPIQITMDGKKVGEAVMPHIDAANEKNQRQEFRSTGTAPDPRKDVQVSGRAIGR